MKAIDLADIHIGVNKDNPIWHDVVIGLFKEIRDLCIRENIDTVRILGDFFHNRKILTQKSKEVAFQIIDILKDIKQIIILLGNHDKLYVHHNKPNWLSLFRDTPNVITVEEEPLWIEDCVHVPWNYDIKEVEEEDVYLFGHFEINGFEMNDDFECRGASLNMRDFNKFKNVFSGHFHKPQHLGNITYLGAPFQMTWSDKGSTRGYYLFDDGKYEFIPFTKAPQFIIIKSDEELDAKKISGNIVRFALVKEHSTNKINKMLRDVEALGPISLDIISQVAKDLDITRDEEEAVTIQDKKSLTVDYIRKVGWPDNLKETVLVRMLDMLIKEVKENL